MQLVVAAALVGACSASNNASDFGTGGSSNGGGGGTLGTGGSSGGINYGGQGGGGTGGFTGDPTTCAEAAQSKSYVGCDFYPTVVANNVWSIFNFAVVVANAGATVANVTVTGNGGQESVTVQPNGLQKIYLPWVRALKGPDSNVCGEATPLQNSVLVQHGAYHLTSTVPVTVYQFNALEYRPAGGPAGKDWSSCPGYKTCNVPGDPAFGQKLKCYSYSNDASLLLPSTAMTGDYRVTGEAWLAITHMTSYFAVTGTANGTSVKVQVSSTGQVIAGSGVQAAPAGGVVSFTLNQGDVAEVVAPAGKDLSGSLVQASHPVQVITGVPCIEEPATADPQTVPACDHIEESVFPAETLGQHYFVAPPTGPKGNIPGYVVHIYGNVDGTKLTYPSGTPPGAPSTINAGQVVNLGKITQAFEIRGDHEFAVGTFMLGGQALDGTGGEGDPSQSQAVAVEQYRTKYVFLAPSDYDISIADVITPADASVTLDGSPLKGITSQIGSGYDVVRTKLSNSGTGAHVLISNKPVGLQVIGYGLFTSYQYPGGLNLQSIAPPPPPIK